MNLSTDFTYTIANLALFAPHPLGAIVGTIFCVFVGGGVYMTFLYVYGGLLLRKEARLLQHKKGVLQELILMKDIQTEMEKEIEKAMLNETYNG